MRPDGGRLPVHGRPRSRQTHVELLERRKTGRYLVAGHFYDWRAFGDLLESATGRKLRRVSAPGPLLRGVGRAMDLAMRVFRFETLLTHEAMCFATHWVRCDDSRTRSELGIEYRPGEETIRDTVAWLAQEGHIPPVPR